MEKLDKISFMKNLDYYCCKILFKVLRQFSVTRSIVFKIKDGILKNYKFSFFYGNDYIFGKYEKEGIDKFINLIKKSDCIYDIGANVGYMTMVFSKLTKNKVYAFEPLPKNLMKLQSHLNINSIVNVEVFPYAVSETSNKLEFSLDDNPVANTYIKDSPTFFLSKHKIEVSGISLDDFISKHEALPPNFIKIDVEGAELDVLKGAKNALQIYKPIILLATHEVHLSGVKKKCIEFLKDLNYECISTNEFKDSEGLEDFICQYKLK